MSHSNSLSRFKRSGNQAERRVIKGESVPVEEKVISLFEPHTDIIVKDKRQVQYGHKINFSSSKHGMTLDAVIESGNPADSPVCYH